MASKRTSLLSDMEEDYGLIRPSLIKQLRSILDQYPDDGQILKELVQNAEDAGATTVKFLHDEHSYPSARLHHPELAQHQGPALYAYNDAQFSTKDWTGIRMLQDSVKENDPMKVGRFGLGFKSVLHMTDLPSVLSADRLFVIDPRERYFQYKGDKTSGYSWRLDQKDTISQHADQFTPFQGIFDSSKSTFQQGHYPATLFRFPLRQSKSELSDVIYSRDRMQNLFRTFETDAHLLLIFLKHIERVQLYSRTADDSQPRLLYEVRLAPECVEFVRRKRNTFSEKMQQIDPNSAPLAHTYAVRVETVRYASSGEAAEKNIYQWLVNEYHAGGHTSQQLTQLVADPTLALVPLVGVAMEIGRGESTGKVAEIGTVPEKLQSPQVPQSDSGTNQESPLDDAMDGKVFCFLPLPIEQKSATGLPVHVNGYFAISQNRRHLKWPTAGQDTRADKSVWWNQLLLREVLPVSYMLLILEAIKFSQRNNKLIRPQDVHRALPDLVGVDEKWQVFLEPFYSRLLQEPIVHTLVGGGAWIPVSAAVFDCLRETQATKKVVTEVLLCCGISVAMVPKHLLHAMGAYSSQSPETISPQLVRSVLHTASRTLFHQLDRPSKLCLLQYILKDEDFFELHKIPLLPLADGSFTAFLNHGEAIFVPTSTHPRELFWGLERLLLSDDLDDKIQIKINKLALEGCTQLQFLKPETAAMLIPRAIPLAWFSQAVVEWNPAPPEAALDSQIDSLEPPTVVAPSGDDSPPASWLPTLWEYLRAQYPRDLNLFSGLPILPLCEKAPFRLVPLTHSPLVILETAVGVTLPAGVGAVLRCVGVHVVAQLPGYVAAHAAVLGGVVRPPLVEDVMDAVATAHRTNPSNMAAVRDSTTQEDKAAFVSYLQDVRPGSMRAEVTRVLAKLPIFPCVGTDPIQYASVCEVPRAIKASSLPVAVDESYIDARDDATAKVVVLLGAREVSTATVLTRSVLPKLRPDQLGSESSTKVLNHVFENFDAYVRDDPGFLDALGNVAFVSTAEREEPSYQRPKELFDPEVEYLQKLFADQEVFPVGTMAEQEKLVYLRKLGLKGPKSISSHDLLTCMISIESLARDEMTEEVAVNKGCKVLDHLSKNAHMLAVNVQGRSLQEWAAKLCWVPVLHERPAIFPSTLRWVEGPRLQRPSELLSVEWAPVVGSVQQLVRSSISQEATTKLGWDSPPSIKLVAAQLKLIIKEFSASEKAKYLTLLSSVYEYLLNKNCAEVLQIFTHWNITDWIWYGDGFTSLEHLVLLRPWLDLTPYYYTLPSEMMPFADLFLQCGMSQSCGVKQYIAVLHAIKQKTDTHAHEEKNDDDLRDLQLSVDLLNYLKDQSIVPELLIGLPVPVHTAGSLQLLPVHDCTYCDVEWVRQGFDLMEFDEQEDGIMFVHPNLPVGTATRLGVPTLMSRMLHAEELSITGFGQGEPLTSRLRHLLQDYTDGLAIFKEMIQNADDAGATEVKFLYDERTNDDHTKYLIDEGMKECQGPALWIYNNTTFTDTDFENITKLGGATKEQEPEKIGRFGLGFNAVYNLTDVPSFVSRNSLVVFDPHTTHLGKGIRDRSKPGIKIDLKKNKTLVKKLPDQFQPYQGVFGCRINADSDNGGYFNGTLFRLPLRTRQQAQHSDISGTHYSRDQMYSLLKLLAAHAHNMLLFTQHVCKVIVLSVAAEGDPQAPEEVFSIHKETIRVIRDLPQSFQKPPTSRSTGSPGDGKGAQKENRYGFLKASANYMKQITRPPRSSRMVTVPQVPQSSIILRTSVKLSPSFAEAEAENQSLTPTAPEEYWFISACIGQEESLSMAKSFLPKEFLVPAGGVAFLLKRIEQEDASADSVPYFVPCALSPKNTEPQRRSQAFCYLPLPIGTGLPAHVNGVFSLETSRRHISEKTDDDKSNSSRIQWNKALMEDAIMHAYVQGLCDLQKAIPHDHKVNFYDLWPTVEGTQSTFQPLVRSFYKSVVSLMKMPLCFNGSDTASLENSLFLDASFVNGNHAGSLALDAFSAMAVECHVLSPPSTITQSIEAAGYGEILAKKTYSMVRFYTEVFFPNISKFEASARDSLVLNALKQSDDVLDGLIASHDCIPCSPDGSWLKQPSQLVHPTALVAKLYSPEDGCFPHSEAFNNGLALSALQRLGLKVNEIEWEDLMERAKDVSPLMDRDPDQGRNRLHQVLLFIDRKLLQSGRYIRKAPTTDDLEKEQFRKEIPSIPFLTVLQKPKNFPLKWAGSNFKETECLTAWDLYSKDHMYLVSSTQPIVDEEKMTPRVKDFLGLVSRNIGVELVMTQLEHALLMDPAALMKEERGKQFEELQKTMIHLYNYLQDKIAVDIETAEQVARILQGRPCILVETKFVNSQQVSLNSTSDCAPYLYGLPADTARRFGPLMKVLGVRENFEPVDYMRSLQDMKMQNEGLPLQDKNLGMSIFLVSQLNNSMRRFGVSAEECQEEHGSIYVPNAQKVLQPSSSLCYNDCPWISETQSMSFTHPDITFKTSSNLGVKTKRQEALSKHAKGIAFGQRERLTNSLKRILGTYPCDHEILKELIQNADDAKATEIHFIRDSRRHSEKHVFDNSWKPLQGPALCVYNNKPFTAGDIEGIQRLGEGSKLEDPSKTGQYGIGFSSVYHLTDVPSVLTSGSSLGKSLCVFDPHCCFVPGSSPGEPGMRYDDVDDLKEAFPDVFTGYLEDICPVENATMFRFPLRTQAMAERSKISNNHITLSRVKSMLDKLKLELFEILLFTNHLDKISISDVNPETGKLSNTYTVTAVMAKEDIVARGEFSDTVKTYSRKLRAGEVQVDTVPSTDICSMLFINDNEGLYQKWCVSQSLGLGKGVDVSADLLDAFEEGELMLMPRGGVAALIEQRYHNQKDLSMPRPSRVYCFLPLPVECHLPVHINGHFALGFENRRHIWTKANSSGFKKEWNDLLCEHVIPRSYTQVLLMIREQFINSKIDEKSNTAKVQCSRDALDTMISTFMAFLPNFSDLQPEWDHLVKAVYVKLASQDVPVMPSVREIINPKPYRGAKHAATPETTAQVQSWQILWLPPNGKGAQKAFFSDLQKANIEEPEQDSTGPSLVTRFKGWFRSSPSQMTPVKSNKQVLNEVLLDCGFKLLEASFTIVNNFQKADVSVDHMSPSGVIIFFRSFADENPACCLGGELPQGIDTTPFKNEKTLDIVLKYCKQDPDFVYKLEGIPLLLTSDGQLRVFDSECPVYFSDHQDLVPERADLFLKKSINPIFKDLAIDEAPVFSKFKIENLAEVLHHRLPEKELKNRAEPFEWSMTFSGNPSTVWLKMFWTFLKSEMEDTLQSVDISDAEKSVKIKEILTPLNEWSLLPANSIGKKYLLPIGQAENVLLFEETKMKYYIIREALCKLKVKELEVTAINTDSQYNLDVAKPLVTSMERPVALLKLLHKVLGCTPLDESGACAQPVEVSVTSPLTTDECKRLLEYFSDHVEEIGTGSGGDLIQMLIDLPLYTTICGDTIALKNCLVYVLPSKIPTKGIDVWQNRSGTVFLEMVEGLQPLYNLIGCASISVLEVYCNFIFQHFEYFPVEDRMVHLHHVYSRYVSGANSPLSAEEKEQLISTLKTVPIVDSGDGNLQSASDFYDPENMVFRIMLPENSFPPRPSGQFKDSEWYSLLAQLGLIKEVSKEMYCGFVQQVAREGKDPNSPSALTKSKVLVQHLMKMPAHSRDEILEDVAGIPFIAPEPADPQLSDIYPQHGELDCKGKLGYISFRDALSKDYEKLVWTSGNLLPEWADPMKLQDLPVAEQADIMEKLEVQKIPQVTQVVSHLISLCDCMSSPLNQHHPRNVRVIVDVFKSIYSFLQQHAMNDVDVKERLAKVECLMVDDGHRVIQPCQAVMNLYEQDEIKPYLYKVPMQLGEFKNFFESIGVTDRVTTGQYARVLEKMKKSVVVDCLTPNEMRMAFKAVRGLMEVLEGQENHDVGVSSLYLPTEGRKLVDATKLVFNDAPSYYDRVKDFGLQFVVDLKECGCRSRDGDELMNMLPAHVRPGMLSGFVKESLQDSSRQSISHAGLAMTLARRIGSPAFTQAIARLVRHEAHKTGKKIDEQEMYAVLDRLSVIKVYGVVKVMTHLTFKGHHIAGSEMEKVCFVERQEETSRVARWSVFIENTSILGQDLLVPLAEVINSILSGLLRDFVLYLLPLLACVEDDMQKKLDSLNVRLDHLQATSSTRAPTLPAAGSAVDEAACKLLLWGEVLFTPGEYIGFREDTTCPMLYAIVKEEIMSPQDEHMYLVMLGEEKDAVIAQAVQMYKFVRK